MFYVLQLLIVLCIDLSLCIADAMDESNSLKVNQFLQVDGYADVFAVGDCNNADQVKMAFKAELQMKVIANNMQALLTGGTMSPYKESE